MKWNVRRVMEYSEREIDVSTKHGFSIHTIEIDTKSQHKCRHKSMSSAQPLEQSYTFPYGGDVCVYVLIHTDVGWGSKQWTGLILTN